MSTAALGEYKFASHDGAAQFSEPLLYIGWDEHMIFAAPLSVPLSLSTSFNAVVHDLLPKLYGQHPEFAKIDWSKVQWFRGDVMFTPRIQATLAENGLSHKSVLRFRTPGLEGIRGSCG